MKSVYFVSVGEKLTETIQIKSTEAVRSCGSIRCDHRGYECGAFPWACLQVTLKLRYSIKLATKTRNLFCDFAPNELNSDIVRFTTRKAGSNVGGKTRNIAIHLVLLQSRKTSCTVESTFYARSLTSG